MYAYVFVLAITSVAMQTSSCFGEVGAARTRSGRGCTCAGEDGRRLVSLMCCEWEGRYTKLSVFSGRFLKAERFAGPWNTPVGARKGYKIFTSFHCFGKEEGEFPRYDSFIFYFVICFEIFLAECCSPLQPMLMVVVFTNAQLNYVARN